MIFSPAARAAKGAALLDQRLPGWEQHINLGALRLQSSTWCICGQQPGGYARTLRALGLSPFEVAEYGFDIPMNTLSRDVVGMYERLTWAWRDLILARRAPGRTPQHPLAGTLRDWLAGWGSSRAAAWQRDEAPHGSCGRERVPA